jgi:nucleoid-associated protein YgaU
MPQLPGRALAKLNILAFAEKDETTNKFKGPPIGRFIALYNPTTFSINAGKEQTTKVTAGSGAGDIEDLYTTNRTLSVELFIDGTGASPPLGVPVGKAFGAIANAIGGSAASVGTLIAQASAQALLSAVAVTKYVDWFFGLAASVADTPKVDQVVDPGGKTLNPKTHKANYLKLIWGKGLRFNGKLQSASVNYTMFNQLGQPIRATISATFIEVGSGEKTKLRSPDLTKVHLVTAGDTIYNIAKAEYDDESFYLQIAQANDLKNYRKLVPGQKLVLPPIAKTE